MKIGDKILHNGRMKLVTTIGPDWIETIYCEPNDKGWKRVEKLHLNNSNYGTIMDLKIGDYYKLTDKQLEEIVL